MLNFLLFPIFIIFLLCKPTINYTVNEFEIRDLEDTTAYLETEASPWQITNNYGTTKTTKCSTSYLLGGVGITGSGTIFTRTYTGLNPHNVVAFSIFFWILDLNKGTNLFNIYFDNQLVATWDSYGYGSFSSGNTCGDPNIGDFPGIAVNGHVPHSLTTLTLKITSLYKTASSSDTFSFGFRNINFLLRNVTSTPSLSACNFNPTGLSASPSCLCGTGRYNNPWGIICYGCNGACQTCEGGTSQTCSSCKSGYSYDGTSCFLCDSSCNQCSGPANNECTNCASNKFLYWDNTCRTSCNAPYKQVITGIYQQCTLPCDSGEFYYQDKSCKSDCEWPFVQSSDGLIKYCNFMCASPKFLMPDGSCSDTCDDPMKKRINGFERYCDVPCDPSTDFYYPNNKTCDGNCPSYWTHKTENGINYCTFPCTGTSFFYADGNCYSTCDSSGVTQIINGVERYCQGPCEDSSDYYFQDGTCDSDCSSAAFTPTTVNSIKYCNFLCDTTNPFFYQDKNCYPTCDLPMKKVISSSFEKYCELPCEITTDFYYPGNKSCDPNCLPPFTHKTENGINYCDFPCESTEFLDYNNNCPTTCDLPMKQVIVSTFEKYCELPCEITTGFYYPGNKSCDSSCPLPFTDKTENGINYCNFPCDTSNPFLYQDNNCYPTCDLPMKKVVVSSFEKYCELPCEITTDYYYPSNNTCDPNCPLPFTHNTQNGINYCNFPCTTSEFLDYNNNCPTTCDLPMKKVIKNSFERYCELPCDPTSSDFYYPSNNTCDPSCPLPFNSHTQNGINYCDFPCDTTNPFLYQDNNCYPTCDLPMKQVIKSTGEKYCKLPCDTTSSDFYYPTNSSCDSNCPLPWTSATQNNIKYCNSPCPSNTFLYYDGSCVASCPASYQFTENGVQQCRFHCSTAEYLYWNQTCHPTCPSPLKSKTDSQSYKTCQKPCSSSQYLSPNNTCLNSCNTTTCQIITDPTTELVYCAYPCPQNQFFYQNNTCNTTCPSPYISVISDAYLTFCNSPCASSQYYATDTKTCVESCDSPAITVQSGVLTYCQPAPPQTIVVAPVTQAVGAIANSVASVTGVLRPSSTNSAFMIALAKMVKYVKYIDVNLPQNVKLAFVSSNLTSFSISTTLSYKMPETLKNKITRHPLPTVFEGMDLHSSYLVNQWDSLSTFSIIFTFGVLSHICELFVMKFTQNKKAFHVMRRLRVLTKWNLLIFLAFNTFDDFTFFAIIEFRTLHFDSYAAYISFFICLIVTAVAIYLLTSAYLACREWKKLRNQAIHPTNPPEASSSFYKRWENYQVTYAGYKDISLRYHAFLCISTVRVIFCYFVVGFLFAYPLVQTIIFFLLSIGTLYMLLVWRPIRDKPNLIFTISFEALILIVNICLLILAGIHIANDHNSQLKENVCQVILITNIIIGLLSNVYMISCPIACAYYCYKVIKSSQGKHKTVLLNMLICIYSNPGMDFDDKSNEEELLQRTASSHQIQQETEEDENNNVKSQPKTKKKGYAKIYPVQTLVTEEETLKTEEDLQKSTITRPGSARTRTTEFNESPKRYSPFSQFKPDAMKTPKGGENGEIFFMSPRNLEDEDFESEPAESHRNMLGGEFKSKIMEKMAPIATLAPMSKKVQSINIDESSSSFDKKAKEFGHFQGISNFDLEDQVMERLTPINADRKTPKNSSLLNIVDLEAPEGMRREQIARSTLPFNHVVIHEEEEDNYFNDGQVFQTTPENKREKAKKAWKEWDGLGNMLDASFSHRETPTNMPGTTPGISNQDETNPSRLQLPEAEYRFSAHVALFGKAEKQDGRHSAVIPGTSSVALEIPRGGKHHTYNHSQTPVPRGNGKSGDFGEMAGENKTPPAKGKNFIQKSWDAGKESIFKRTASLTMAKHKSKGDYENLDANMKNDESGDFQDE